MIFDMEAVEVRIDDPPFELKQSWFAVGNKKAQVSFVIQPDRCSVDTILFETGIAQQHHNDTSGILTN